MWGRPNEGTYLSARYRRLGAHRGYNRAVVAIGHQILTFGYFMIRDLATYDDLVEDFYDRQHQEQLKLHQVNVSSNLPALSRLRQRDQPPDFSGQAIQAIRCVYMAICPWVY